MTASIAIGLLLLRLVVGLTIAGHGAQKLFGWFGGSRLAGFIAAMEKMRIRPAGPFALMAGLGEFGGGILIILGFLSPAGPLIVAGGMVVAIGAVHLAKGFWNTAGGYEFPLLLMGAALALSITGPGAFSVDAITGIKLPEPLAWIVLAIVGFGGAATALASRRLGARRLELG